MSDHNGSVDRDDKDWVELRRRALSAMRTPQARAETARAESSTSASSVSAAPQSEPPEPESGG
ncbi:MAG: hypothetical protein U1F36_08505 [Planctomycetota bacterium]